MRAVEGATEGQQGAVSCPQGFCLMQHSIANHMVEFFPCHSCFFFVFFSGLCAGFFPLGVLATYPKLKHSLV